MTVLLICLSSMRWATVISTYIGEFVLILVYFRSLQQYISVAFERCIVRAKRGHFKYSIILFVGFAALMLSPKSRRHLPVRLGHAPRAMFDCPPQFRISLQHLYLDIELFKVLIGIYIKLFRLPESLCSA